MKNVIPKYIKLLKGESLRSYGTPMSSTYHPEVDELDLIKGQGYDLVIQIHDW